MRVKPIRYDDNEKETLVLYTLDSLSNGTGVLTGVKQFIRDTNSKRTVGALLFQIKQLRQDEKYKKEFAKFPTVKRGRHKKETSAIKGGDSFANDVVESSMIESSTREFQESIEMTQTQFAIFVSKHIRIISDEELELRQQLKVVIEQRDRERERVQELLRDKDALSIQITEITDDRDSLLKAFRIAREFVEGVPSNKIVRYAVDKGEVVNVVK